MRLHHHLSAFLAFVSLAPPAVAATFTAVTAESGVQAVRDAKPSNWWFSGETFIDLDHDGDLDLFFSGHTGGALAAVNDGTGHFTLAEFSGAHPDTEVHLPYDLNEDGRVDFDATYVDGGAKWWVNGNAGGSTPLVFTDMGNVNTRDGNQSRPEALVDINRDGYLDWVRGAHGNAIKIDFGDADGHFAEDSATVTLVEGEAQDTGIMFADFDGDNDEDLLVNWGGYGAPGNNDYGRIRLFVNDGSMGFTEKTTERGLITDHFAALGVGDVDQDGDTDIIGFIDHTFPEVIYANDGSGHFSQLTGAVTGDSGSAHYSLWGLAAVTDMDNDGVADILIDGRYFFHVLRGTGGGHFVFQNTAWGGITTTAEANVDGGFSFGDMDNDGDLDLIAFLSGEPQKQPVLYRNDLPAQHWLNIRPQGNPGNRGGISSKIRIYAAGTDDLLWYEEVAHFSKQAQQNYYAFDALERHYGLGSRESVDVTITFYPSNVTVRKNGALADSTLVIGEDGSNGVVEPPAPDPDPDPDPDPVPDPEPDPDPTPDPDPLPTEDPPTDDAGAREEEHQVSMLAGCQASDAGLPQAVVLALAGYAARKRKRHPSR